MIMSTEIIYFYKIYFTLFIVFLIRNCSSLNLSNLYNYLFLLQFKFIQTKYKLKICEIVSCTLINNIRNN